MCKERIKRYEAAGITKERYLELKYLTRQYDSMKKQEAKLRRGEIDRKAGGNRAWRQSDPTGNAAIGIALRSKAEKIRAIEEAARTAAPGLYVEMLKCVTRGESYEKLKPPCGRGQFYAMRRQFFVELDRRIA